MKVVITGQLLQVHQGNTKDNKPYAVADVYDGTDLIKIWGYSGLDQIGQTVSIPVRLNIDYDKRSCFIVAIK